MKIHPPEIHYKEDILRYSARVETRSQADHLPKTLWFEFPREYESFLHPGMEGFVATLVPLAMALGEDIEVEAPLSPRLVFHLKRYQQIYHHWQPHFYQPIAIHCDGYRHEEVERGKGVGLFFSGGVDSFYTLYQNMPENQPVPGYQVTHGIFLFRFDLHTHKEKSYKKFLASYQRLFDDLGLELIPASYNDSEFVPRVPGKNNFNFRGNTYSAGFSGCGLTLSRGLHRLLIASSSVFTYTKIQGSSYLHDQELSTEWFEIVHDGLVEDRMDKTSPLASWAPTYNTLRVCWWQPDGVMNCGKCPKCVRTMTGLELIGALDRYTVFPKPFRPWRILRRMTTIQEAYFADEMFYIALKRKRWGIAVLLGIALVISKIRKIAKSVVQIFAPNFEGFPAFARRRRIREKRHGGR